jgi:hypothetical protein
MTAMLNRNRQTAVVGRRTAAVPIRQTGDDFFRLMKN